MFTELLRRLEGPAELLGIALRTILQYGAGAPRAALSFIIGTLPVGLERTLEIPDSAAMTLASRNSGSSRSVAFPSLLLLPKAQLLCYTGAESNPQDRVLGEIEKDSFIALSGKAEHTRLLPQKTMCPNPERI